MLLKSATNAFSRGNETEEMKHQVSLHVVTSSVQDFFLVMIVSETHARKSYNDY